MSTVRATALSLRATALSLLAAMLCLLAPALARAANEPEPHWYILNRSAPSAIQPGREAQIVATVVDLGDAPVLGGADHVVVEDALPAGLEVSGPVSARAGKGASGKQEAEVLACSSSPPLRCVYEGTLPPYIPIDLTIPVRPTRAIGSTAAVALGENVVTVQGGQDPEGREVRSAQAAAPIEGRAGEVQYGVERFAMTAETESGEPDVSAGTHPFQLTTTIEMKQTLVQSPEVKGAFEPATPQLTRNLATTLPSGLIGDPEAMPQCSEVQFTTIDTGNSNDCPADTAIGVAVIDFREYRFHGTGSVAVPVFNLVPAYGEPARFGFEYEKVPAVLQTSVQTGSNYAVVARIANNSQTAELLDSVVTIWGVPQASSHDDARGWECLGEGAYVAKLTPKRPCEPANASAPAPYLTLPTQCSQPPLASLQAQSWSEPEPLAPSEAFLLPRAGSEGREGETLQGCGQLPFDPTFGLTPFTQDASTPTGLKAVVEVPQGPTLEAEAAPAETARAEADVQAATVRLPSGVMANAGLAYSGLQTCAAAQAGFLGAGDGAAGQALYEGIGSQSFTPAEAQCPEGAKIGDVKIVSPVLEHPLAGSVYLANQDTDPFASPLVLYVTAYDPVSGVRVKLAGEVQIGSSGELTSVFRNTPPVPFEKFELILANEEDGQRAASTTPPQCGQYSAQASFTPYSQSAVSVSSQPGFQIASGPDGSPCPPSPLAFGPGFEAGPTDDQAGALTPFVVKIKRQDGQQQLGSIDMTLPPGEAALLREVTPCPQAQAEADACSEASLVGSTVAVSGLGGKPIALTGQLYLTGPLSANGKHGASPFGLLAATHVQAGPFDLGEVNVFSTISVNETTAAATIDSEPIPDFVRGVPAQLKEVIVTVQRPGDAPFQFNPTNCQTLSLTGALSGWEGASDGIAEPFYVTGCPGLPFAPKLTATVGGQASKAGGASLKVTIQAAGLGQANIHRVDLTLPKALPSRLSTIQKACPAALFESTPADPGGACDAGSVIGEGIAHTPVFAQPLRGLAYLVSYGGAAFPDVEFVLKGEGITLRLDGHTQIKNGVTYSKFETAPDAPLTRFEAILPAGPHSALTAIVPASQHYNLCNTKLAMPTEIAGQNGALIKQTTAIVPTGCPRAAAKPTRAQLLARALKQCRTRFGHRKSRRQTCERQARKRYGPKAYAKKARRR